jgi:hypothetical protein
MLSGFGCPQSLLYRWRVRRWASDPKYADLSENTIGRPHGRACGWSGLSRPCVRMLAPGFSTRWSDEISFSRFGYGGNLFAPSCGDIRRHVCGIFADPE